MAMAFGIKEPMPRPYWDPKLRKSSAHLDSFLRRLYDRKAEPNLLQGAPLAFGRDV